MTVLITGAGIVGSQIARQLVERGERPVLLDLNPNETLLSSVVPAGRFDLVQGDVRDFAALQGIVSRCGITAVAHSAALLTGPSRENPRLAVEVNVGGAVNMLELARQRAVRRVVLCGSTTITYPAFDSYVDRPIPEDFEMRVVSQAPKSFYSATKLAAEFFTQLYRAQWGADAVVVRYGAVLGAWGGANVGLVARLLSELIEPALQGRESVIDDPALLWDGVEEFIDARDCASGTIAALDAAALPAPVYTLSSDRGWTFDQFSEAIREVCPGLRVRCEAAPQGGFARFPLVRHATSDIRAAARDLRWTPQWSLRESIRHVAEVLRARDESPDRPPAGA